jgi:SAM-dependent methyltransferase
MSDNKMKKIFSSIYENGLWGTNGIAGYRGSSGSGSSVEYNKEYIAYIKEFLHKYNIRSVSDIGCGDWRVGEAIFAKANISYFGYDIYLDLIEYLKTTYQYNSHLKFMSIDVFEQRDTIEPVDLLIIKDVLQHWDDSSVSIFIEWIKTCKKFKYILITNCNSSHFDHIAGQIGGWRGLDSNHPLFKNSGFIKAFQYQTKEIMLYESDTIK